MSCGGCLVPVLLLCRPISCGYLSALWRTRQACFVSGSTSIRRAIDICKNSSSRGRDTKRKIDVYGEYRRTGVFARCWPLFTFVCSGVATYSVVRRLVAVARSMKIFAGSHAELCRFMHSCRAEEYRSAGNYRNNRGVSRVCGREEKWHATRSGVKDVHEAGRTWSSSRGH